MGKYSIDFRNFVKQLLPSALQGNVVDFVYVMTEPMRNLHKRFASYRNAKILSLEYNAQYFNLQRMLNDIVDPKFRKIYVTDANIPNMYVLYNDEDMMPIPISNNEGWIHVLYPHVNYLGYCATVLLHAHLSQNQVDQVKQLLDQYMLAGTKYSIEYI